MWIFFWSNSNHFLVILIRSKLLALNVDYWYLLIQIYFVTLFYIECPCMLCILTREPMLAHAFSWSKTIKNTQKWVKKYLFHHAYERHTRGLWRKQKKKVCWSAIGSDSQKLVNTLKLVAHLEFCGFYTFFYMSNACEWCKCSLKKDEKDTFVMIFKCFWFFSTMQMHAQACICWSKYTTLVCSMN